MSSEKTYNYLKYIIWPLFALVLLPSNLKAIVIGIVFLSLLLFRFKNKFYLNKKFFITNGLFFFFLTLTLIYSSNLGYGIKKLSTMSSLVVFPFMFSLLRKEERNYLFSNLDTYLKTYIFSIFILNAGLFIWFWATNYTFDEMLIHFATAIDKDAGKFNIHPIYISIHCALAIIFSAFLLFKNQKTLSLVSLLLIDAGLLSFILLYSKKGPIIALVLVLTLLVLSQKNINITRPYLMGVFTFILLIATIPKTREKFYEIIAMENLQEGKASSTNIRYSIYTKSLEVIEEAPVLGYGIGDYNERLFKAYYESENYILQKGRYNSHNQILSFLLIGGIVLMIVFMGYLTLNFLYAIRLDNKFFIAVMLFYFLNMLTENILEREDGVIFFALFLNLFSLNSLFEKLPEINNKKVLV
ncbi:O-antigen ligase family protein [Mesonia sp.]|uniref:O-antigen ligase family protein n=1 Tax=Mesonia sp. TaxID=1960830 RepID=UPI001770CB97|nr:O-antigen ligase family protein [Mesonia sp.]HIB36730.1 O-antigen ligase domain-containing protein [Mesonia sp.]HIO27198.1 O-antigen ligase domain-containing protein [Flavobacteriaceae bacterium]